MIPDRTWIISDVTLNLIGMIILFFDGGTNINKVSSRRGWCSWQNLHLDQVFLPNSAILRTSFPLNTSQPFLTTIQLLLKLMAVWST